MGHKHPIAATNVAIINEMQNFISEAGTAEELRNIYLSHPDKDFTRERVLLLPRLTVLILRQLKRSLSTETDEFFAQLSPQQSCSKQAFSAQRSKLKPVFFQDLNGVLVENFYCHYCDKVKKWKGLRVWAVDGSTVTLPDMEQLREEYGSSSNQHGSHTPLARVSILYDVLNGTVVNGMIRPSAESEETMIFPCLEGRNTDGTLLVFDRGYYSYWLMYRLQQMKINFVIRASKTASEAVKQFVASSATDTVITLYPSIKSRKRLKETGIEVSKSTGIKVRPVKIILNTGETEVLVASLFDRKIYTKQDLSTVYGFRWGVEICYGFSKNELQPGQFSGIRPICIEQDFFSSLIFYNLQSLTEKQTEQHMDAVSKKRKYKYKLNKNISWGALKRYLTALLLGQNTLKTLIKLEKEFIRHCEAVRPGRKYPRTKKNRPNEKYFTLTNYKRAL